MMEIWNRTRKCWKYLTGQAASLGRETESLLPVRDRSSELKRRLKKLVKQLVNSCFCFQLARWNELCATSIISLWWNHLKLCLVILNLSMCPIIAFKKRSSWCQGNWPIISHFLSPSFFNATVSQILELLQF